ncbi:unnamed protein product [Phyllotreta striolata]|uniref:Uncharacterized protein n=1 Tax=Phyllotreta striolata TaxID=444603 RepID=A0A9N9XLU6_PHYSR|nr:unnamed protein product [Phyllotreta striolata]
MCSALFYGSLGSGYTINAKLQIERQIKSIVFSQKWVECAKEKRSHH